eukprot:c28005_g1_i1 orf=67-3276(+)
MGGGLLSASFCSPCFGVVEGLRASNRMPYGGKRVRKQMSVIRCGEGKTGRYVVGSQLGEGVGRLKQRAGEKGSELWRRWRDLHSVYREDTKAWGIGMNPIFRVSEDAEGRRQGVFVDEGEILRRVGIEGVHLRFAAPEQKDLARERIDRARKIAKDIEIGVKEIPVNSTLYKFERCGEAHSDFSVRRILSEVGSVAIQSRPFLKTSVLVVSTFSVLYLVWGAYLLFSKKTRRELKEDGGEEGGLMEMRGLKTETGRNWETETLSAEEREHPLRQSIELEEKLEEIRRMARHVRSVEQMQAPSMSEIQEGRTQTVDLGRRLNEGASYVGDSDESLKRQDFQNRAENMVDMQSLGTEGHLCDELPGHCNGTPISISKNALKAAGNRKLGEETEMGASYGVANETQAESLLYQSVGNKFDKSDQNPVYSANSTLKELGNTDNSAGRTNASILDRNEQVQSHKIPFKPSKGVKPRIIISTEEAKARIAASKAKAAVNKGIKFSEHVDQVSDLQRTGLKKRDKDCEMQTPPCTAGLSSSLQVEALNMPFCSDLGEEEDVGSVGAGKDGLLCTDGQSSAPRPVINSAMDLVEMDLPESVKEKPKMQYEDSDPNIQKKGIDVAGNDMVEKEEHDWMRDEVLREIVFTVQANEKAGKEPFYGLDSNQEKLFFKGLERKFEREGARVKNWIEEHVENIDYGRYGIAANDPPEAYELRWKDPAEAQKSQLLEKFMEDRKEILRKQTDFQNPSPFSGSPTVEKDSSIMSSQFSSPSAAPNSYGQIAHSECSSGKVGGRQSTDTYTSTNNRTIIAGSGQPLNTKGPFQHTKRWGKDLQRKYKMERNPEIRGLMREIGQDLENWITEQEVETVCSLLSKDAKRKEEYAQQHYEGIKAKMKGQRERFGWEAMVNKYKEYKPKLEDELWWLDLTYVLCIRVSLSNKCEEALYCLDMAPAFEEADKQPAKNHVIAFQDRKDALKFCYLLQSKCDEYKFDDVKVCPYPPKQLHKDAKAEGFGVTVLKEGQFIACVGQTIDEVEQRIVEIGSAGYWEKLLRDRSIDVDAVLDQGFNYGSSLKSDGLN